MRMVFLYRFQSEYSTEVENFCREVERRYPNFKAEKLDIDTKEGDQLATTYDITSYPTILALKDDGQLIQMWVGMPLPTIDEIVSYNLEHA